MKKKVFFLLFGVLIGFSSSIPVYAETNTELSTEYKENFDVDDFQEYYDDPTFHHTDNVTIINQNKMDTSYPHDSEVTVNIHLDPKNNLLGMTGYTLEFTSDDDETEKYSVDIPWQEIEKDENGNLQKIYTTTYDIPAGDYTFTVSPMNAEIDEYCYQKKIHAEKDQYYTIEAIAGSEDFVKKNKKDKIPDVYQNMGDSIWDGLTVEAMQRLEENEKAGNGQVTMGQIADSDGTQYCLRDEYFRTYVTFTSEQKAKFFEYLKTHPATDEEKNVSQQFADFCKANNIEILLSIDEYDGLKNADNTKPTQTVEKEDEPGEYDNTEEPDKKTHKSSPIVIIFILIAVAVAATVIRVNKQRD